MIAVIDYGVGNLFSLCRSLEAVGQTPVVTGDPAVLRRADKLFLPGWGLCRRGGEAPPDRSGPGDPGKRPRASPFWASAWACSFLFEESREFGTWQGLGLLPGKVVPMEGLFPRRKNSPHRLERPSFSRRPAASPAGRGWRRGGLCVFCPSFYAAECDDVVIATAEYGAQLTAAVARGNVMGCQFHPEKSGTVGLTILKTFCEGNGDMILLPAIDLFGGQAVRLYQGITTR